MNRKEKIVIVVVMSSAEAYIQKYPNAPEYVGIILCMRPANERQHYNVTWCLIGWAYVQNSPWIWSNK